MTGRRRTPIAGNGPRAQLALRLRALRDGSGLTLRQVAARSGYSLAALSNAESGRRLPSWDLVEAFVRSCGSDPARWRQLWEVARESAPPDGTEEKAVPSGTAAKADAAAEPSTDTPSTDAPPTGPAPEAGDRARSRRRGAWIAVSVACAALAVTGGVLLTRPDPPSGASGRPSDRPAGAAPANGAASSAPSAARPAQDGSDPYEAGCRADQKQLDWQTVRWADGKTYGTLILMYSRACRAAWGYLQGPVSHRWTVHTDAHRDPDGATAPASYRGDQTLPGSWGDVLSTRTGCVYVEAHVDTPGHPGPPARTSCIRP
jgi:transcriptional regulator with XRE-family HTH domain